MADNTKIEWADTTWNPVKGCTRASEGCRNCYAEVMAARFNKPGQWGHGLAEIVETPNGKDHRWTGDVRFDDDELLVPLGWRKPRRVFVCSTSDLFHDDVTDEMLDLIFAVIERSRDHTFMVLTKRPARMQSYIADRFRLPDGVAALYDLPTDGSAKVYQPPRNVMFGVSVEDQASADERIPYLLKTPAFRRFLSCEPLLGPVDLTRIMEDGAQECFHQTNNPHLSLDRRVWTETRSSLNCLTGHYWGEDLLDGQWEGWCGEHEQASPGIGQPGYYRPLDWIIVGGESGPGARPMHPDWARSLRDQCQAAGVPFFFKQVGEWFHESELGWWPFGDEAIERCQSVGEYYRVGKKAAGRLLDGREWNEVPA